MSEAGDNPRSHRWGKALIVGGIVFCLLGTAWIWLPEMAAFGLRLDATHEVSLKTLKWLGPRAARQVFENRDGLSYWRIALMRSIHLQAEKSEQARASVISSLQNPNLQNEYGQTFLHSAARRNCTQLSRALLEAGADVNLQDNWGQSPLYLAASRGHVEVAGLLVSHGADVNLRNDNGKGPLYIAALNSHVEVAGLLISHGVDVNARGAHGNTLLDLIMHRRVLSKAARSLRQLGGKTAKELDSLGSDGSLEGVQPR